MHLKYNNLKLSYKDNYFEMTTRKENYYPNQQSFYLPHSFLLIIGKKGKIIPGHKCKNEYEHRQKIIDKGGRLVDFSRGTRS